MALCDQVASVDDRRGMHPPAVRLVLCSGCRGEAGGDCGGVVVVALVREYRQHWTMVVDACPTHRYRSVIFPV